MYRVLGESIFLQNNTNYTACQLLSHRKKGIAVSIFFPRPNNIPRYDVWEELTADNANNGKNNTVLWRN